MTTKNNKKLRSKIRERYRTQGDFADALGIRESSLSQKLSGRINWMLPEIERACALLDIQAENMFEYFYNSEKENMVCDRCANKEINKDECNQCSYHYKSRFRIAKGE